MMQAISIYLIFFTASAILTLGATTPCKGKGKLSLQEIFEHDLDHQDPAARISMQVSDTSLNELDSRKTSGSKMRGLSKLVKKFRPSAKLGSRASSWCSSIHTLSMEGKDPVEFDFDQEAAREAQRLKEALLPPNYFKDCDPKYNDDIALSKESEVDAVISSMEGSLDRVHWMMEAVKEKAKLEIDSIYWKRITRNFIRSEDGVNLDLEKSLIDWAVRGRTDFGKPDSKIDRLLPRSIKDRLYTNLASYTDKDGLPHVLRVMHGIFQEGFESTHIGSHPVIHAMNLQSSLGNLATAAALASDCKVLHLAVAKHLLRLDEELNGEFGGYQAYID